MLKMVVLASIMLAALFAADVSAQETITDPKKVTPESALTKFMNSPEVVQGAARTLHNWDKERGYTCDEKQSRLFVDKQPLEIYQPVVFDEGKAAPSKGVWTYRYTLERCNSFMKFRIGMDANEPTIKVQRVIAGESDLASATIQRAMRDVKPAVQSALTLPDCDKVLVIDSYKPKLISSEAPAFNGGKGRHIRERWWVLACGKRVALDVDVLPNPEAAGTTQKVAVVADPGIYIER